MTTYNITINERTSSGRELIQHLSEMPDIVFKKVVLKKTVSDDEKMFNRMKKAARNAKKIAESNPKTYSAKELMEIL